MSDEKKKKAADKKDSPSRTQQRQTSQALFPVPFGNTQMPGPKVQARTPLLEGRGQESPRVVARTKLQGCKEPAQGSEDGNWETKWKQKTQFVKNRK